MDPWWKRKIRNMKAEDWGQSVGQLDAQFIDELDQTPIFPTVQANQQYLEKLFQHCSDVVIRNFEVESGIPALIVFVDGLVNNDLVHEAMKAVMILEGGAQEIDILKVTSLPVSQIQAARTYKELLLSVMSGDTAIFVDRNNAALLLGMRGPKTRSVDEPDSEAVVRGPREGFIESVRINTSLIRRKLKTPRLKMKPLTIGKHTNTSIVITYLDGVADPATVREVENRLQNINIDGILESGYIEELIQDNAYSPFPQVQYTERPDTVAAALLNGRVGIIVDGTPFVLIVPTVFWDLVHAAEDYYERFQIVTLIRWLRYILIIISLVTPALYVAGTTFHQEMIPTQLLLSVAAARESIPFPAVVEALIMEVTFEALREAGIRLPKTIGQAVSILGALVVGQAAVEAGIVSAPMVIVVSITGIASFTIPRFNGAIAIRMLRFPLILAASVFGIFGILTSIMIILCHMANLRSFGVPYLSPVAPMSFGDQKDVLIRAPWWFMSKRPRYLAAQDTTRMEEGMAEQIAQYSGQTKQSAEQRKEGKDRDSNRSG